MKFKKYILIVAFVFVFMGFSHNVFAMTFSEEFGAGYVGCSSLGCAGWGFNDIVKLIPDTSTHISFSNGYYTVSNVDNLTIFDIGTSLHFYGGYHTADYYDAGYTNFMVSGVMSASDSVSPLPTPYASGYNQWGGLSFSSYPDGTYFLQTNTSYAFFTMVSGLITDTSYSPFTPPTPLATCTDGILNQDETIIDTDGVCNISHLIFSTPVINSNNKSPVTFSGTFTNSMGVYDKIYFWIVPSGVHNVNNPSVGKLIDISGIFGDFSLSIPLPSGSYKWSARLYNSNNDVYGDWFPSPLATVWYFGVNVTPIVTNSVKYEECNILDVGCGIRNAFQFLIIPADGFLVTLQNAFGDNMQRFPLIYIQTVIDTFDTLKNNTNSNNMGAITVPFGNSTITLISADSLSSNPLATPVRNSLTVVIWILLAFTLYSRAMSIFNNNFYGSTHVTPAK